MIKEILSKIDLKALWEAVKLPLRLAVFAAVGFIVDALIAYFSGVNTQVGVIIAALLTTLDKYIHEIRSKDQGKALEGFQRGLLPF
jgi:hypothetical protein